MAAILISNPDMSIAEPRWTYQYVGDERRNIRRTFAHDWMWTPVMDQTWQKPSSAFNRAKRTDARDLPQERYFALKIASLISVQPKERPDEGTMRRNPYQPLDSGRKGGPTTDAGGHTDGGHGSGARADWRPSDGMNWICSAYICGGMLLVITPLYQMRTRLPGRKKRAFGAWTMTLCRVLRSNTMRRLHCTSTTTASMNMIDTSLNRYI